MRRKSKKRRPTAYDKCCELKEILEHYRQYFTISLNSPSDVANFDKAIELTDSLYGAYDGLCDELRNVQDFGD